MKKVVQEGELKRCGFRFKVECLATDTSSDEFSDIDNWKVTYFDNKKKHTNYR